MIFVHTRVVRFRSLLPITLMEKQKEGTKRMKRVGRVEIPQEAFLAVLKVNEQVHN